MNTSNHQNTPTPVRRVEGFGSSLRPAVGTSVLSPDSPRPRRPLTDREKQILRLVCDGMTNAQIGTELRVARETVKSELKRIFHKIEVKNRTQAAVLVVRNGLV